MTRNMPQTRSRAPRALPGYSFPEWQRVLRSTLLQHTTYIVKDPVWWQTDWQHIETSDFVSTLLPGVTVGLTNAAAELFDYSDVVVETGTNATDSWEVLSHYVDRVAEIPAVRLVALSQSEEEVSVWTVISAPQFEDDYRRPVYDAQSEAIRLADAPFFTFRVINLEEVSAKLADVLPERYLSLFERAMES